MSEGQRGKESQTCEWRGKNHETTRTPWESRRRRWESPCCFQDPGSFLAHLPLLLLPLTHSSLASFAPLSLPRISPTISGVHRGVRIQKQNRAPHSLCSQSLLTVSAHSLCSQS